MRKQPKADSSATRVNLDNERVSKFDKEYKKVTNKKKFKAKKPKQSDPSDEKTYKKSNDSSWYSKNPELLKSAASIPFAAIAGAPLPNGTVVPGIMSLNFEHNFNMGISNRAQRQAFDSMFSYIVHANSRNYTYDSIDLAATYYAGADLFSMLAHMVRAYGITKYYTEESRYSADAFLEAMGFYPDNFRRNLGQIWFDINRFIDMSRQIWLPNTMPLLARWIWLNSNIFKDSDGPRAQYYLFNQSKYFKYTNKIGNKVVGSSLIAASLNNGATSYLFTAAPVAANYTSDNDGIVYHTHTYNWNDWARVFEDMLNALINDEDRGIMYGDILKAYGQEKIFAFPSMPSDYVVIPQYNQEVLTQIENATTVGGYSPIAYVQEGGQMFDVVGEDIKVSLVTTLAKARKAYTPMNPVLNFHQPTQPTPEQIMVATRMQAADAYVMDIKSATFDQMLGDTAFNYQTIKAYVPNAMGTEFINTITAYSLLKKADSLGRVLYFKSVNPEVNAFFDWAPFYYSDYKVESQDAGIVGKYSDYRSANGVLPPFIGDLDNFTLLNGYELEKLHTVAIYSLLGVPQL